MADSLALLVALGLGLLVGAWAGARIGLAVAARRRAALGAHAQLARLWPTKLPARSATDILAGVIRLALGGRIYELPVLPRAASRRWLTSLDARFAGLAADLERAGDDTPAIMVRLVAEADALYDMLLDYDRAGGSILPGRDEIDETATDTEILRAVLEVWRAVNPLAATLADDLPPTSGVSPAQLTTPLSATAGAQPSSSGSPKSSSSPTSTPPRNASSAMDAPSSSVSSRPSASAQASSTTSAPTPAGGHGSGRARRSQPRAAGA